MTNRIQHKTKGGCLHGCRWLPFCAIRLRKRTNLSVLVTSEPDELSVRDCLPGARVQRCGSPVATSKGRRYFEAPTEPTGETLTTCLGWKDNDSLPATITTKLSEIMRKENGNPYFGILHHEENVDLLPANLELSAMEMMLVTTMSRETVMRTYLNKVKDDYEYIETLIGLNKGTLKTCNVTPIHLLALK